MIGDRSHLEGKVQFNPASYGTNDITFQDASQSYAILY